MKNILITITILLSYLAVSSQNYSATMNLCSGDYTLTSSIDTNKFIKVTIQDINKDARKVEYRFAGTNLNNFMSTFQNQFLTLSDPAVSCTQGEKDALLSAATNLWYGLYGNTNAPKAGTLTIANTITIHALITDTSGKDHNVKLRDNKVQEVHIELNNGYIETIYAIVLSKGLPRTYINYFGIGFATFQNFSQFEKINLIELHARPFYTKGDSTKPFEPRSDYIKMSDLLNYIPELEVDRRDYSPKDTSLILKGGQSVALFKEQTSRLFEARFFSDFVGLQEDKPNGLIQTEVAKRINISSVQWKTTKWLFPVFKSWGIFQYISPTITLSKLEQHNKRLLLGNLDSIRLNPGDNDTSLLKKSYNRYATPLDLYQHQSFSGGFDLNFFYFSNHSLKYNVYLSLGTRLGFTPIIDSQTTITQNVITKSGSISESTINTLQLIPQATVLFLPEERIKFATSYQLLWLKPFSTTTQLLTFDKDNSNLYSLKKGWLNTFELLVTYDVNPNQKYNESNGKLFGRLRFTSELNNFHTNFAQVQIGYAAFILGNKR